MGLMTGVLRVAKEGILSGLNNLDVWTVFDEPFSQYFGFTKDEVVTMARYYGAEEKLPEIRAWYDGYDFAGTEIYNPWSVITPEVVVRAARSRFAAGRSSAAKRAF